MIFYLLAVLFGIGYTTWRMTAMFPLSFAYKWVVALLWLLGFIILIFSFALRDSMPMELSRITYPIVTSWVIYLLYAVMLFLVLDVLRLVPVVRPYLAPSWSLVGSVWIVFVLIFTYGSIQYRNKVRVSLGVKLNKPLSKPLKIVALSDMHLGYTIGKGELAEWVKLINAEKPDLVLIAGDIVDGDIRAIVADRVSEVFNKIEAPVYACLGNHEYIDGEAQEMRFLGDTKVCLLKDSVALFDNQVYIVGRDDRSNPYRQSTASLLQGVDKTKPIILLDHQPYNLDESQRAGVDFQLSGHTHRGQVFPLNLIVDRMYELSHGYKQKGNTHYYISSGIGIWGGKYRIGTQSEYLVLTLE